MAKIIRYNGNLVPFASASLGTERTLFGSVTQADDITSQYTASFLRGWGIVGPSDEPTLQDFNAVSYTHGQILSYLHQIGIAEYNAAQEYHLNSVCNSAGIIYVSLIKTNVGNTPVSSPSQWAELYAQATETVRGTAEIATTAEVTAGTDDARTVTPLKLLQRLTTYIVQATESVFGWAKIATQVQTNTGTDDNTIVTPKKLRFGVTMNIAATGYLALPSWLGGLIIEWGSTSVTAGIVAGVTFPLQFPVEFLSGAILTGQPTGNNTATLTQGIQSVPTATGMNLINSSGTVIVRWIVIGH
jgi:hypothetical protein